MAIKLIGFSESPNVLRVVATLKELGLPYEFERITNFEDIKSPEFLASKQPFGLVPVLIDDGLTIYESRAIARYLVNKYQGNRNLYPSDVRKAALVDQFISVEASHYDVPLSKLSGEEVFSKFFGNSPDPEKIKKALEEIDNVLDVYEKILEGKEYIAGEFSLADILHCPNTHYAIATGHNFWNDPKRPNIARWWKNISGREAWKKVAAEIEI